jgi:hypothetical protein
MLDAIKQERVRCHPCRMDEPLPQHCSAVLAASLALLGNQEKNVNEG